MEIIKSSKTGTGIIKYLKGPIEYKYIYNLNQLKKCLLVDGLAFGEGSYVTGHMM